MLVVATDGACRGNPGRGGWAWVTEDDRSACGGEPTTTNNRMELQAVLDALETLDGPLLIQTDSEYVKGIFTGWLANWKAKNRLRKQKNLDLIEAIDAQLQGRHIEWLWVRGHAGHPMNELADLLATSAADALSSRTSTNRVTSKERTSPKRSPRPYGFPAKFAGTCGNCATRFSPGVQITKSESGRYVHADGCPSER